MRWARYVASEWRVIFISCCISFTTFAIQRTAGSAERRVHAGSRNDAEELRLTTGTERTTGQVGVNFAYAAHPRCWCGDTGPSVFTSWARLENLPLGFITGEQYNDRAFD